MIFELTGGIPRRINTLCNRLLLASYLSEKHALATSDVQAIAQEIREEMGPDSGLVPVGSAGEGAAGEAQPPARIDAAIWHRHFHQIEERIDRLETTVGAAVDLLHALLHPDKAAKPGSPKAR